MPTCKGNVGNLMQHWTLCELLNIAQQRGVRPEFHRRPRHGPAGEDERNLG